MKFIDIQVHVTKEGSNKVTEIPLDSRDGLYFKIVTDTFETSYFNKEASNVPVRMFHDDRSPLNVTVAVEDGTLKVSQIYQQSERLLLITCANDDWSDVSEVRPVYIDALNIDTVTLNGGAEMNVVSSVSNNGVRLQISDKSGSTVYSQALKTIDGHSYIFPISWSAHNQGTSQNPNYDYHYATVDRAILVFTR